MFRSTAITVAAAILVATAAAQNQTGTTFSSTEQEAMRKFITAGETCKQQKPTPTACTGECAINDEGKCDLDGGKMMLDAMGTCATENPMMKSVLFEATCGKLNQTACTADKTCDYKDGSCKIGEAQGLLLMLGNRTDSVLYKISNLGLACSVGETTCQADENCEWNSDAQKCDAAGSKIMELLGTEAAGKVSATALKCSDATSAPDCQALGNECHVKLQGGNTTKCEANGEKIFTDLFKEEQRKNPAGAMLATVLKCAAHKTSDTCKAERDCHFKAVDQECEMSSQKASDLMFADCGKNNAVIKMMKLGSTCDALKSQEACAGNTDCMFKTDEAKCEVNDKFYMDAMVGGIKNAYFKVFIDVSTKCAEELPKDKCPKDTCSVKNNKCTVNIQAAFERMSAVGGGSKGDWKSVRDVLTTCQSKSEAGPCTSQVGCRWKGKESECDLNWNTPSIIKALKGKGDPDLDSFVGYVVDEAVCEAISGGTDTCAANPKCGYKDDEQQCSIRGDAFMKAASASKGNGVATGPASGASTASSTADSSRESYNATIAKGDTTTGAPNTAGPAATDPTSSVKALTAAKELADKKYKEAGCDADATKAGCADLQKAKDEAEQALKKAEAEADADSASVSTVASVATLVAGVVVTVATF